MIAAFARSMHPGCRAALRRIDDYVDRELDILDHIEVELHLAECIHCAHRFDLEARWLSEVRARVRRIAHPPGLRSQVLASLAGASGGGIKT